MVKLLKKLNGRVSEVSRRSRKGPPDIGKIATHQQLALLEEQPRD